MSEGRPGGRAVSEAIEQRASAEARSAADPPTELAQGEHEWVIVDKFGDFIIVEQRFRGQRQMKMVYRRIQK